MNAARVAGALGIAWTTLLSGAFASGLKQDETVVFFPGLAWRADGGQWMMETRGWVYEPERRPGVASLFGRYLGLREQELSAAENATFAARTKLFLVDSEKGKSLTVRFGPALYSEGKTGASGQFSLRASVSSEQLQQWKRPDNTLAVRAVVPEEDSRQFSGVLHVIGETGLSVISDLDDTIKISNVRDRTNLLYTTFVREFEPVRGMAEVYRSWAEKGAVFHYVSASPCQLYPVISDFLDSNRFPAGSVHLSVLNWRAQAFHKASSCAPIYKPSVIEPLLQKFPRRQFVLVGDSGESDPEIYAALARKYPRQIERIFIRDVTRSAARRYAEAFADVPREKWFLFGESIELTKPNSLPVDNSN